MARGRILFSNWVSKKLATPVYFFGVWNCLTPISNEEAAHQYRLLKDVGSERRFDDKVYTLAQDFPGDSRSRPFRFECCSIDHLEISSSRDDLAADRYWYVNIGDYWCYSPTFTNIRCGQRG
jgi:hypothetical protein